MQYVCILQSQKNGQLYKGCTNDLKKRQREHNSGKVPSTKPYTPWELMYYEAFTCKRDALREEKFLKNGKGRDRITYLLKSALEG